jgi:hypothetical protein
MRTRLVGLGYVWKRRRMPRKFLLLNLKERALQRPLSRWENNVKMDLKGIEWECVDFVHGPGEGWLVCCCEPGTEKVA